MSEASTYSSQIHWEDIVEASATFHFVARAAVCSVQLQIGLLHTRNISAMAVGWREKKS
jgi:hypothetical protein